MTLEKLKSLVKKSTKVDRWLHSGQFVKGPFFRWFEVNRIYGHDADKVADAEDDALYCAAAMNSVPELIERCEKLSEAIRTVDHSAYFQKDDKLTGGDVIVNRFFYEDMMKILKQYGAKVPLK